MDFISVAVEQFHLSILDITYSFIHTSVLGNENELT